MRRRKGYTHAADMLPRTREVDPEYPAPRDVDAWMDRFTRLPEHVQQAIYDHAPSCHPEHREAVAWAVIAATEAMKRVE